MRYSSSGREGDGGRASQAARVEWDWDGASEGGGAESGRPCQCHDAGPVWRAGTAPGALRLGPAGPAVPGKRDNASSVPVPAPTASAFPYPASSRPPLLRLHKQRVNKPVACTHRVAQC